METLVWGWDHMPKQVIFGKLLELAYPIVQRYRSDFYHDAMWLNNLDDHQSVVFYYAISESGTYIMKEFYKPDHRVLYKITVAHNGRGDWSYGAEKID